MATYDAVSRRLAMLEESIENEEAQAIAAEEAAAKAAREAEEKASSSAKAAQEQELRNRQAQIQDAQMRALNPPVRFTGSLDNLERLLRQFDDDEDTVHRRAQVESSERVQKLAGGALIGSAILGALLFR